MYVCSSTSRSQRQNRRKDYGERRGNNKQERNKEERDGESVVEIHDGQSGVDTYGIIHIRNT